MLGKDTSGAPDKCCLAKDPSLKGKKSLEEGLNVSCLDPLLSTSKRGNGPGYKTLPRNLSGRNRPSTFLTAHLGCLKKYTPDFIVGGNGTVTKTADELAKVFSR